jgi:hypothetical protein
MALRKGSGWAVMVNGIRALSKHRSQEAAERRAKFLNLKALHQIGWVYNGHSVNPRDWFTVKWVD